MFIFLKELNNSNKKVEESNNDKGKPKLWDSSKNKLWEWVELIFKSGGASGNTIATYLFGTEGLDMYLPGSGILFEEGIHATIGGTGGVTITFT